MAPLYPMTRVEGPQVLTVWGHTASHPPSQPNDPSLALSKCPSLDGKLYGHSRLREPGSSCPLVPPSLHVASKVIPVQLSPEVTCAILPPFLWPGWSQGLVDQPQGLPKGPDGGGEPDKLVCVGAQERFCSCSVSPVFPRRLLEGRRKLCSRGHIRPHNTKCSVNTHF